MTEPTAPAPAPTAPEQTRGLEHSKHKEAEKRPPVRTPPVQFKRTGQEFAAVGQSAELLGEEGPSVVQMAEGGYEPAAAMAQSGEVAGEQTVQMQVEEPGREPSPSDAEGPMCRPDEEGGLRIGVEGAELYDEQGGLVTRLPTSTGVTVIFLGKEWSRIQAGNQTGIIENMCLRDHSADAAEQEGVDQRRAWRQANPPGDTPPRSASGGSRPSEPVRPGDDEKDNEHTVNTTVMTTRLDQKRARSTFHQQSTPIRGRVTGVTIALDVLGVATEYLSMMAAIRMLGEVKQRVEEFRKSALERATADAEFGGRISEHYGTVTLEYGDQTQATLRSNDPSARLRRANTGWISFRVTDESRYEIEAWRDDGTESGLQRAASWRSERGAGGGAGVPESKRASFAAFLAELRGVARSSLVDLEAGSMPPLIEIEVLDSQTAAWRS